MATAHHRDRDRADPLAEAFYGALLGRLHEAAVPVLVGGSYAFSQLTGIGRPTKDLDLFIRHNDWPALAGLAQAAGWRAELAYPHWLGKVHHAAHFVDAIFGSGNGVSPVDDEWFAHAPAAELFGQPVRLVPAEESLWTKAFIMERERFDGADVAHLLKACAATLDWPRLQRRFGAHWRVLLAHLVLFGFIYPGERDAIPGWLLDELLARLRDEATPPTAAPKLCAGTLLSREQYLGDLRHDGYIDARLRRAHTMSAADVAHWTQAIDGAACVLTKPRRARATTVGPKAEHGAVGVGMPQAEDLAPASAAAPAAPMR